MSGAEVRQLILDAESVYICNRYYLSHTLLARKTAQVFRDLARG